MNKKKLPETVRLCAKKSRRSFFLQTKPSLATSNYSVWEVFWQQCCRWQNKWKSSLPHVWIQFRQNQIQVDVLKKSQLQSNHNIFTKVQLNYFQLQLTPPLLVMLIRHSATLALTSSCPAPWCDSNTLRNLCVDGLYLYVQLGITRYNQHHQR